MVGRNIRENDSFTRVYWSVSIKGGCQTWDYLAVWALGAVCYSPGPLYRCQRIVNKAERREQEGSVLGCMCVWLLDSTCVCVSLCLCECSPLCAYDFLFLVVYLCAWRCAAVRLHLLAYTQKQCCKPVKLQKERERVLGGFGTSLGSTVARYESPNKAKGSRYEALWSFYEGQAGPSLAPTTDSGLARFSSFSC